MALIRALASANGGGGGVSPLLIDKGAGNQTYNNHEYTVESGKTYMFVYLTSGDDNTPTTINGGSITAILEDYANGTSWGGTINYHIIFVKSTSTMLKFYNANKPLYSPMLYQID